MFASLISPLSFLFVPFLPSTIWFRYALTIRLNLVSVSAWLLVNLVNGRCASLPLLAFFLIFYSDILFSIISGSLLVSIPTFSLAFFLIIYLASILTFSLTLALPGLNGEGRSQWAVPTEIWCSRLRSLTKKSKNLKVTAIVMVFDYVENAPLSWFIQERPRFKFDMI